jgi:hypothetical protein
MVDRNWVLERRLAAQGLGSMRFESAADAVRRLGCVQSQELILGLSALGLRAGQTSIDQTANELSSGDFVRTHILRPTWHYVAAEDLRWFLAATSPKVERSLAHRHRDLGLDGRVFDRFLDRLTDLLRGRSLSRPQLRTEFPQYDGSTMSHLLLVAELRGVICSGTFQGPTATYRLVDDLVPPVDVDIEEAKLRLVHRFFAGHGPADIADLTRWAALTKTEVRNAIAALGDRLERVEVDDFELFWDPSIEDEYASGDFLLHTFDEATLTYPRLNFPRTRGNPLGENSGPFLDDAFAGAFVSGTECAGGWRLFVRKGIANLRLSVVPEFQDRAERAADSLLSYLKLRSQA